MMHWMLSHKSYPASAWIENIINHFNANFTFFLASVTANPTRCHSLIIILSYITIE